MKPCTPFLNLFLASGLLFTTQMLPAQQDRSGRINSRQMQEPREFTVARTPPLQTQSGYSSQDLITNVLIGGSCLEVSNVKERGYPATRGVFSNGLSSIGLNSGVVLATGNIAVVEGPNYNSGASGGYGYSDYDPDLAGLTAGEQFDLSVIEFDFKPSANMVSLDFVFGSEEYCEYVNSQFNDVFGIFISGPGITGTKNIALVPGNDAAVSINNVNHLVNSLYYVNNTNDAAGCQNLPPYNMLDCQLDGWTKKLTAQTSVVPCATYHLKIAIADIGDGSYDSAVFFRANSFNAGNGTVSAAPVYFHNLTSAYEDCGTNYIRFSRANGDNSQPLTVDFSVSGASTATSGADFVPLNSPVVIPAGQNEVLLPVTVISDAMAESPESIVLLVNNMCTCTGGMVEFLIRDSEPLSVTPGNDTSCGPGTVTLAPVFAGGVPPYTYHWNTGESTASIARFVAVTTNFTVTVTDQCNATQVQTLLATVLPKPMKTIYIPFCPGDTAVINGQEYYGIGTYPGTLPGSPCDTAVQYVLQLKLQQPALSRIVSFCPGDSVVLGGEVYYSPGTVIVNLPNGYGTCDTLATYTLQWAYPEKSDTLSFCPGSSVTINGVTYTGPGTALDTIPSTSGACDTVVQYVLRVLPEIARTEYIALCPGALATINGVSYAPPAIVNETIPGLSGACDTVVTYHLSLLAQVSISDTFHLCPGSTLTLNGVSYTAPNTVTVNLPGLGSACDTIATYLLLPLTPSPSLVKVQCPADLTVAGPAGTPGEIVGYNMPTASTDCPCPGLDLGLSAGLLSGEFFPLGATQVCYTAKDSCGNSAACCFTATVEEAPPCDTKEIGCMKWELLDITQNAGLEKTYRVRVTNSCSNRLAYALIQLPDGVAAVEPYNNSTYTAPSGRQYKVRNPSQSGFYSIQFSTVGIGIANGQSDIFKYTLPPTAQPAYIHVGVRLSFPRAYFESHLNTFFCPVGNSPDFKPEGGSDLRVFPNPTSGALQIDLSAWATERLQVLVLDGRGQLIKTVAVVAEYTPQPMILPENLPDGMYFLKILTPGGERQTARFVVQH